MFKVEVGEPDYIIQVYEDKQIFGKLVNYHFHPNAVEGVVNYTSPQCDNGAADGAGGHFSIRSALRYGPYLAYNDACPRHIQTKFVADRDRP